MWCGVFFFRLDAPASPCARSRARGRVHDKPTGPCNWLCRPSLRLAGASAHASRGPQGGRPAQVWVVHPAAAPDEDVRWPRSSRWCNAAWASCPVPWMLLRPSESDAHGCLCQPPRGGGRFPQFVQVLRASLRGGVPSRRHRHETWRCGHWHSVSCGLAQLGLRAHWPRLWDAWLLFPIREVWRLVCRGPWLTPPC